MRNCLLILFLAAFCSCHHNADTSSIDKKDSGIKITFPDTGATYVHKFTDTELENKITAALMKLPFIIKSDKYIDSFSNHKHGIAFMLDTADNYKEIYVRAGYNGDERFETYYHFYVNPANLAINVYDVIEDRRMTVKEYIKSQQNQK